MKRTAFKDIVTDYRAGAMAEEISGMWGVVLFFRMPGFALAKVAISLGISATALTASGIVVTLLIACAGAFLPPPAAIPAIAVLAAVFQIIDCADGTVARATATSSSLGRFLDFSSDVLWRTVYLAAIGHVADRLAPDARQHGLAIGLMAGFCATYARLVRNYVRSLVAEQVSAAGPVTPVVGHSVFSISYAFLSGLDELFPLIALAAWSYGWLDILMIGVLIYHGADAVIAVVTSLIALRNEDRRGNEAHIPPG